MGKGDKKSKKGKIAIGSFGVSRNRRVLKAKSRKIMPKHETPAAEAPVATPEATKPRRTVRKKTEA